MIVLPPFIVEAEATLAAKRTVAAAIVKIFFIAVVFVC
jgi:hypothetical protein